MSDLVTLAQTKEYLGIPTSDVSQDARLTSLITYVSDMVEESVGHGFESAPVVERVDGGGKELILNQAPVLSVSQVFDKVESAVVTSDTYVVEEGAGLIFYEDESKWADGRKRFEVSYTAGSSFIPNDIALAVLITIASKVERKDGSITSIKIGDYSRTFATDPESSSEFPPDAEAIIRRHRRLIV